MGLEKIWKFRLFICQPFTLSRTSWLIQKRSVIIQNEFPFYSWLCIRSMARPFPAAKLSCIRRTSLKRSPKWIHTVVLFSFDESCRSQIHSNLRWHMFAYNEYIDVKKPQSRNFYLKESRLVTEMKKKTSVKRRRQYFLRWKNGWAVPKMRSAYLHGEHLHIYT